MLRAGFVCTALWVSTLASAMPCEEIRERIDAGTPLGDLIAELEASGVASAEAYVAQCLSPDIDPVPDTEIEVPGPRHSKNEPRYAPSTEIDFDGLEVQGELVKPTGSLLLDRKRSRFSAPSPADPVPNTEHYTDYGVHPTTLTEDDFLSTFSIDVDTASYTLARSKLSYGHLPPTAAVRAEEFVNWLPYDYAPPDPSSDAPFAVHMAMAPNPITPNRSILRVALKGHMPPLERPPVHLTFLVDTSGSMNRAEKLPLAIDALHHLVDHLGIEDTIALATYAGSHTRVLGPTPITRRTEIHRAIDSLRTGGGTAMGAGMDLAYQMASDMYLHGHENRVIVLSDGDANIGRTTHDQILASIRQYAEEGITLTTVGFGMGNYKDTLMEQLADQGDGNYFYVDRMDEAKRIFGTELSGTLQTIARDVKIQVAFDPGTVRAYRLIGYENRDIADADFRNDAVDAGEIGAGHAVTALYSLTLRDAARRHQRIPVATVHVRAKDPGPDVPAQEWETPYFASHRAEHFSDADSDLKIAWVAAAFAEKLRDSPHAQELDWSQLIGLARQAQRGGEADADLLGNIVRAAELSGEEVATAR